MSSDSGAGTAIGVFLGMAGAYWLGMLGVWIYSVMVGGVVLLAFIGLLSCIAIGQILSNIFEFDAEWYKMVGTAALTSMAVGIIIDVIAITGPARAIATFMNVGMKNGAQAYPSGQGAWWLMWILTVIVLLTGLVSYAFGIPIALWAIAKSEEVYTLALILSVIVIPLVFSVEVFRADQVLSGIAPRGLIPTLLHQSP